MVSRTSFSYHQFMKTFSVTLSFFLLSMSISAQNLQLGIDTKTAITYLSGLTDDVIEPSTELWVKIPTKKTPDVAIRLAGYVTYFDTPNAGHPLEGPLCTTNPNSGTRICTEGEVVRFGLFGGIEKQLSLQPWLTFFFGADLMVGWETRYARRSESGVNGFSQTTASQNGPLTGVRTFGGLDFALTKHLSIVTQIGTTIQIRVNGNELLLHEPACWCSNRRMAETSLNSADCSRLHLLKSIPLVIQPFGPHGGNPLIEFTLMGQIKAIFIAGHDSCDQPKSLCPESFVVLQMCSIWFR